MLIDSHCHLDDAQFAGDPSAGSGQVLDAIIHRANDVGVVAIVTAGVDIESSRAAVRLAERYASVYAVVGIHPEHADTFNAETLKAIRDLAQHSKVVGIGEIGLDFHYADGAPREAQEKNFSAQLELAAELGKPVVIHDRDAHAAVMNLIAQHSARGLLHCFSGDRPLAERAIELGYYISFAGNLTFPNARSLHAIARVVPLERVVIETDAPYLAPTPRRGQRNEPANVARVAEKIAELKNLPIEIG